MFFDESSLSFVCVTFDRDLQWRENWKHFKLEICFILNQRRASLRKKFEFKRKRGEIGKREVQWKIFNHIFISSSSFKIASIATKSWPKLKVTPHSPCVQIDQCSDHQPQQLQASIGGTLIFNMGLDKPHSNTWYYSMDKLLYVDFAYREGCGYYGSSHV